jgi:hypothetical protein
MTENDFISFLKKKKIDSEKLKAEEPLLYKDWLKLFLVAGSNSFDQQKKFLFNALRKKYLLK